jgi:uncharacterized OB-fold protein
VISFNKIQFHSSEFGGFLVTALIENGVSEEGPRFIGSAAFSRDSDGTPLLIGSCCTACGVETVPPVPVCPVCGDENVKEREQPREGTLYSYTVLHVGPAKWRRPLALGYVDLPNGVRVFSHLDCEAPKIGEVLVLGTATVGRDFDGAELQSYVFRRKDAA